jgi:hypothetical protein
MPAFISVVLIARPQKARREYSVCVLSFIYLYIHNENAELAVELGACRLRFQMIMSERVHKGAFLVNLSLAEISQFYVSLVRLSCTGKCNLLACSSGCNTSSLMYMHAYAKLALGKLISDAAREINDFSFEWRGEVLTVKFLHCYVSEFMTFNSPLKRF